ncbi:hypothetical protein GCM10007962_23310 [Yeosuana aromativorans]|uniref:Uncharacterized protein n=1 Tax=Yeosuana aromativorans TaxID=288019 RepID=A0A8J3FHE9_9FLAO|nr:hypothetical protein [Yeosuana aromativorans]GGK28373.1 hypothetical protein GCM10007962_23310 [Yeosuana aromativorans]
MKKICYCLFLLASITLANNNIDLSNSDPQVGDVLIINKTNANGYKHIFFPNLNIISKRGGLANYNIVEGNHAIIKKVETNKIGDVYVHLVRKNGKKFFGCIKKVRANYTKSLESGELSILKT